MKIDKNPVSLQGKALTFTESTVGRDRVRVKTRLGDGRDVEMIRPGIANNCD